MSQARVTVAIPLYRSGLFLDSLRRNLEILSEVDNVCVVVSDRHQQDDTIDVLQRPWRGNPRFHFIKGNDRLNWVTHMNQLLKQGDSEYFRWLPHDDLVPAGCLEQLVAKLDSDAGTVLAYGPTRGIDAEGARWPERDKLHTCPIQPGKPWTYAHSLDLFWRGWCDGAFKGLFRRREVLKAGLLIRPTRDLVFAERAWLFGVSLLGGLAEVTESLYLKRFHNRSTSAAWRPGPRHVISATATMCGYLRDHGPRGLAGLRGHLHQWSRAAGAVQRLPRHRS